ncbi:pilus assembly protein [Crenothrix polyspora]|uniref:Putative Tfp pilus assembly protein, tip-associated adhesin PilY1 n=1 Tax=Crenothrix polyspora TaxID=360316 RepID=A0A1R4H7Y8_9GAMM|nr:PilC/PilY family type IV pilus protein [Crenothrix polyspora]SJM92319.1 putative Tfp pilus assembly protein, tip-associated adhesin PilY1 [Crenothrix polyspora]
MSRRLARYHVAFNAFKQHTHPIAKNFRPVPSLYLIAVLLPNTSAAALAQSPLFLTLSPDPNVLINFSAQEPMGGAAYSDQPGNPAGCKGRIDNVLGDSAADNVGSCYFPDNDYLGYFDAKKCYDYSTDHFNPGDMAIKHTCSASINGRWSGNFLNWVSMTAIDEFIWAMTGGNRISDTPANTVVQRALSHPSWFPVKVINHRLNVAPASVTPYTNSSLYFDNAPPSTNNTRQGAFVMHVGTGYANASSRTPDKGIFNIHIKLCENPHNKEANCTAYTTNGNRYYKPEGLLQKNASAKRFALNSYPADNTARQQGGVLRANMKYIGPLKPDASGAVITNPNAEFSSDGLLVHNPDGGTDGLNSGIINYLNQFSNSGYPHFSPTVDLFYQGIRYFKNQDPTPETHTGIRRTATDNKTDGFWFYKAHEWQDPIQYACQKNTIIAVNAGYPWQNKSQTSIELSSPVINNTAENANSNGAILTPADSDINVKALTDQVGALENGQRYQPEKSAAYSFDLTNFTTTDSADKAICIRKNIVDTGLGSVINSCTNSAEQSFETHDNPYLLAGLAWYANSQDLRTDLTGAQTINTYVIGNTSPNTGPNNPLWLTAKYGGFIDSNADNNPNTVATTNSEWDNNTDGEPDHYLQLSEPLTLISALNTASTSLAQPAASASAVTSNTAHLTDETQIFQATFNSQDWSGALKAFAVDNSGTLTPTWEAWIPAPNERAIYTYNPTAKAGAHGIVFQWEALSKDTDTPAPVPFSQQHYLNTLNTAVKSHTGALRLNWLRGLTDIEKTNNTDNTRSPVFRKRNRLLGDIVNSEPVFVGTQDYGYGTLASIGGSYNNFRHNIDYSTRRPMLYAGANDGMLHGFDASAVKGGKETFAYVPNALFPELSKLPEANYSHQYYVDGALGVGDVYDGSQWHSLLAGTTGAGARAVFALDITYPDSFSSQQVLWEFSNTDDTDLGYTLAQPSVVRLQDGHWAVLVSNGYDSDNGHAVLFILDALTGAVLQKLDTDAGTTARKNGLSSPVAVDTNNDHGVDSVYAGDLYGNLWKFDLSASAGNWPVPIKPLFVACTAAGTACNSSNRQAITGKPTLGKVGLDQNNTGLMVYFGTGKYIDTSDNSIGTQPQLQTFYGIWDQGTTIADRASLQEQSISYQGFANTRCASGTGACATTQSIRVLSKNTVCYSAASPACTASSVHKNGWALNLVAEPYTLAQGERVISSPLLHKGSIMFSTTIPNPDSCQFGGKAFLMQLDALTGGEFNAAVLDVNNDNTVDAHDKLTIPDDNQHGAKDSLEHFAAGIDLDMGLIKTPLVIEGSDSRVSFKYINNSAAKIIRLSGLAASTNAKGTRKSWRQLQ